MAEITVLVPVYNVEKYLRECLDSIVNQTFEDMEVICINDGSTDSSGDILREYERRDPRIRVIKKPNSGYGSSMNLGLRNATGRYVAILESDDIFELDALEKLHAQAQAHDAEVVKADFWLFWSTPEERRVPFGVVAECPIGRKVNPRVESGIFYAKPSIWSALYRRDFLEANEVRFLETPGASYQDAGFNFKVWASASRAVFLDDQVLSYRQDNEQSSVNSPSKAFCVCDEYAEMRRYLAERPEGALALTGILERMKFDTYMWNYDRLGDALKEDFLSRAAEEFGEDIARGDVDFSLFEPWAEADLNALVNAPEKFRACRAQYLEPGKVNTFKHYYKLGGWPLIAKVISYKVGRRR